MTDPRELPHLVLLLDDPSPVVEEGVRRALDGYGDTLPGLLRELEPPLTGAQRDRISYLLQPQSGSWLRAQWPGWRGITDDDERLERAATLISDYLGHRLHPRPTSPWPFYYTGFHGCNF